MDQNRLKNEPWLACIEKLQKLVDRIFKIALMEEAVYHNGRSSYYVPAWCPECEKFRRILDGHADCVVPGPKGRYEIDYQYAQIFFTPEDGEKPACWGILRQKRRGGRQGHWHMVSPRAAIAGVGMSCSSDSLPPPAHRWSGYKG